MRVKNVVLAVGAHPDDIEMGCGGALAKHLEVGDEVYCLVLTNGERGNHSLGREECLVSSKLLGLKDIFFGGFTDGFLTDDFETVNLIEGFINKLGVNRVYTHSPHDRHQDHRNCSRAVSSAARKITEILFFQGPSTTTFEPHYFIQLSDGHFEKKISSVRCYKSQIGKGVVDPRWLTNLAELNGAMCNEKYAEAFAVNHIIRGKNDV